MKEFMNNPNIEITPFLLSNKTIHDLVETVHNYIKQDLEPGTQLNIVQEPKDTRRVLITK